MSDNDRAAGPFIRWADYGTEGWKPESYPTLDAAVKAQGYGERFVITRLINWFASAPDLLDHLTDDGRLKSPSPSVSAPEGGAQ